MKAEWQTVANKINHKFSAVKNRILKANNPSYNYSLKYSAVHVIMFFLLLILHIIQSDKTSGIKSADKDSKSGNIFPKLE
jgi:hypothetical protein